MKRPSQAVILAGGRGERLRPLTDSIPKPMAPVNDRPFLAYLVDQLRDQGIERVVVLTGYRGEAIHEYFGNGGRAGVAIDYSHGPAEWDTGRRVWEARSRLDEEFLLLYSDNYVPFTLDKLVAFHERGANAAISLLLSPKQPGNIRVNESGLIEAYDSTRSEAALDYVEIGYMLVRRDEVLPLLDPPNVSFSRVLRALAARGALRGMVTRDAYHSISDPERLAIAARYLAPKRILLIDRDGTLNERPARGEYVARWGDFRWMPGAVDSLRALAREGFRFIVLSNQAGIARGVTSAEAVADINRRMAAALAAEGVEILDTYVCPHHWDERCECRKPAPGMFHRASREHLLRLDRTVYIGDDPRDAQAAYNADCLSILVGPERELTSPPVMPVTKGSTLRDVVPWIVRRFEDWERFLP